MLGGMPALSMFWQDLRRAGWERVAALPLKSLNADTPGCFRQSQPSGTTKVRCSFAAFSRLACALPALRAHAALLALGLALTGCAEMSDTASLAFADPAKYDLYDCKQLETERKYLANRAAEFQGLMAKAETGAGGPVVAEMVYRNDLIAIRGQSQLAEQAWRRSKCRETIPAAAMPVAPAAAAPACAALARGKSGVLRVARHCRGLHSGHRWPRTSRDFQRMTGHSPSVFLPGHDKCSHEIRQS